jgi:hypothetical protein
MIMDIKDEATRNSMIDFAVEHLAVANSKLSLHYKVTCSYGFFSSFFGNY